jgi:hypothetical protein
MSREAIDQMWQRAMRQSIEDNEMLTRYHFDALVRADEREQGQKWFDAVTAQHRVMILAEREACAKVCEQMPTHVDRHNAVTQASAKDCAAAIRARGETK